MSAKGVFEKSRNEQIVAWSAAIIRACRLSQSAPNVFESIDDWAQEIRRAAERNLAEEAAATPESKP